MNLKIILKLLIINSFLLLLNTVSKAGEPITQETKAKFQKAMAKSEHLFRKNDGQWDDSSLFKSISGSTSISFYKDKVVFGVRKRVGENTFDTLSGKPKILSETLVWTLHLDGVKDDVKLIGQQKKSSNVSYHLNQKSIVAKEYRKLVYKSLYSNIDMVFYTNSKGQLKYDLMVAPGGNPDDIRFSYSGIEDLTVQDEKLKLTTSWMSFNEDKPYTFQEIDGVENEIACAYEVNGNSLNFNVDDYDLNQTLVIDPIYVDWSTYFYGEKANGLFWGWTWIYDIDIDDDDNVYLAGITSEQFPQLDGMYDTSLNSLGFYDAFVCKLNPSGDSILAFTYIGGSNWEWYISVTVNELQEPVIAGITRSDDFPITSNAYDDQGSSMFFKGFVTKIKKDFSDLVFSTYLGGSNSNMIGSLELNSKGDVFIVGSTQSWDFPTTSGAYEKTYQGTTSSGGWWNYDYGDGFFTILKSDGSDLIYSTYFGGGGDDPIKDIHVADNEDIYLVGGTNSSNFPTTPGFSGFNTTAKQWDGFILKFTKNGGKLVYSHLVGGTADDIFESVYVNSFNEAYVAGISNSTNYYTTQGAYQRSNKGNYDIVVSKFNKFGSNFFYSTYIGGSNSEKANFNFYSNNVSIAANIREEAIICGLTSSSDFPITSDALQSVNNATGGSSWWWTNNACIAKLDMMGEKLLYGTYFGGSAGEISTGVKLKRISCFTNILYCGITLSDDFPVTKGAYRDTSKSSTTLTYTGFAAKFRDTLYTEKIDFRFGDTLLECDNVFEPIDAKNQGADFLWSTGHTGRYLIVQDTGELWVQATYGCDTTRDTIQVVLEYSPVKDVLPDDRLFCDKLPNEVLDAKNDTIPVTYIWNTGDTTQTIVADLPQMYIVKVESENCGFVIDSVDFTYMETPDINFEDSLFCDTVYKILTIDSLYASTNFLWSTGDTVRSILIDTNQAYWGKAWNECGMDSASYVSSILFSPEVELPKDSLHCTSFTQTLKVGKEDNEETYLWEDRNTFNSLSQTDSLIIREAGDYWITIKNKCGEASDNMVIRQLRPPTVSLGADEIFCDAVSKTLYVNDYDRSLNDETILWDDNSFDTLLYVDLEGKNWVTVTNDCGSASDTIEFELKYTPQFELGLDSIFCESINQPIDVTMNDPDAQYFLNNTPSSSQFTLQTEGIHYVKITNHCGEYIDSIRLGLLRIPSVTLDDDKVFCGQVSPTTLTYQMIDNDESVLWSNNDVAASAVFNTPGKHWVQISNRCGTASDTIAFFISDFPIVSLPTDTVICGDFGIPLDAGYDPSYQYNWQPTNESSSSIIARLQTEYVVTVTNADGCSSSDNFEIGSGCVSFVHIPSGFSPNDDHINDEFKPVLVNTQNYTLSIYNRWGEVLFETNDPDKGWDGSYQSEKCQNGVYFYQIKLETTEDERPQVHNGVVNLVR